MEEGGEGRENQGELEHLMGDEKKNMVEELSAVLPGWQSVGLQLGPHPMCHIKKKKEEKKEASDICIYLDLGTE